MDGQGSGANFMARTKSSTNAHRSAPSWASAAGAPLQVDHGKAGTAPERFGTRVAASTPRMQRRGTPRTGGADFG